MNKDTLISNVLGGQSIEEFLSLLIWGLLGLIFSISIELVRHNKKIKRTGGFNITFYLKDNLARFISTILAMVVGIIFKDEFFGISDMKGAIIAGLVTDKIIEAISKFKDSINIQSLVNVFTKKQ